MTQVFKHIRLSCTVHYFHFFPVISFNLFASEWLLSPVLEIMTNDVPVIAGLPWPSVQLTRIILFPHHVPKRFRGDLALIYWKPSVFRFKKTFNTFTIKLSSLIRSCLLAYSNYYYYYYSDLSFLVPDIITCAFQV